MNCWNTSVNTYLIYLFRLLADETVEILYWASKLSSPLFSCTPPPLLPPKGDLFIVDFSIGKDRK